METRKGSVEPSSIGIVDCQSPAMLTWERRKKGRHTAVAVRIFFKEVMERELFGSGLNVRIIFKHVLPRPKVGAKRVFRT